MSPTTIEAALAYARELVTRGVLEAGERRLALVEVEVYLRSPAHPDPFVHAHPAQAPPGRFYFHRQGASLRGGSFKGLDVTIGGDDAIGGVLLRSGRWSDGRLVSGPSLLVDDLLAATASTHGALAAAAEARACDAPGPLRLTLGPRRPGDVLATARVGLTLKRHVPGDGRPAFLLRRYRLLTEPRAVTKGRVHTVLALHQDALDAAAIRAVTGSPRARIEAWIAASRRGADASLVDLARAPRPDLAAMHGAWAARFGAPEST